MTNAKARPTRQARPATARTIPSIERHYPGADVNTAQLVDKLRRRGITDPRASVRATSRDLMEDAYRGVAPGQTVKRFDNNYSPYSNVNAEAAAEVARLKEEARRRAEAERLRQNGAAPRQKKRSGSVAVGTVRTVKTSAVTARGGMAPVARRENGQLAESGPREVAIRRVPFPKFAFVVIFMCIVLFFMIQSFVHVYEYKRENAELREQVNELVERESQLRAELEDRIDVSDVEAWAKEIGMINGGQVDENYIDLSGGDVIENFGGKDDGVGSFSTMLSAIIQRIAGLLGSGE